MSVQALMPSASSASATASHDPAEDVEGEMSQLRAQLAALTEELDRARQSCADKDTLIQECKGDIEGLRSSVEELESRINQETTARETKNIVIQRLNDVVAEKDKVSEYQNDLR